MDLPMIRSEDVRNLFAFEYHWRAWIELNLVNSIVLTRLGTRLTCCSVWDRPRHVISIAKEEPVM